MRARIVGIRTDLVNLAYGDVLHGRRRENIERDEFVVGVRRSDGLSVECRDAVTVAQAADDQLPGRSDRDARHLANTLLHVGDTLERHLFGPHILDRDIRGDALGLQGPFRFKVLAGGHRHRGQHLIVGIKLDHRLGHPLCNPELHPLRKIRDIGDDHHTRSGSKIQLEAALGIGRRSMG